MGLVFVNNRVIIVSVLTRGWIMSRASKMGTHVRLPDGREGTTVYNGLDGIGIKWGIHYPSVENFKGTSGGCCDTPKGSPALEDGWPWMPDAMLRNQYPGADIPCVGEKYEIIYEDEEE